MSEEQRLVILQNATQFGLLVSRFRLCGPGHRTTQVTLADVHLLTFILISWSVCGQVPPLRCDHFLLTTNKQSLGPQTRLRTRHVTGGTYRGQ